MSAPRLAAAGLLIAGLLLPASPSAETVVARRRVGNNTEGLTYDPARDRAYAIDGNDVIAVAFRPDDELGAGPDAEIAGPGFARVFDVLGLDPRWRIPRGIAWVPPLRRFLFSSLSADGAAAFATTDAQGRPRPLLAITGLDTTDWSNWEGLAWIPPEAPAHGGTIAGLGMRSDFIAHVYFIRPDGSLEGELVPQPGTPLENYLCGIQYWPQRPGTLLVSDCGASGIYAMDLRTGAWVGDPTRPLLQLPEAGDVEGIVVRRNGQILLSGYETGRLFAFDGALGRAAGQDRLLTVGVGASAARLAWNGESGELVATSPAGRFLHALSPDLRSGRLLGDLAVAGEVAPGAVRGIGYLGRNRLAVTSRFAPRGVDVIHLGSGHSLSRLLFLPPTYPASFGPSGVGALGPDRLVLRTPADPSALKVVSTAGTPDASLFPDGLVPDRLPDIPLSAPAQGLDAQLVDLGAGPLIFTGAELYDLSGQLVRRIDGAALGLAQPPLATGAWIGGSTFATVDPGTSTVVVYTVP